MLRFDRLTGIAAPLPLANIDTDKILPGRFLKTVSREGLGGALFDTLRFDAGGAERPDFVLNRLPWRNAAILIAGDNFGCGSSREHAPWALLDFGIRCVIAPGFADIFYNNCFRNGILPIVLGAPLIDRLTADAAVPATAVLTVDLPAQQVHCANGAMIAFTIAPERKRMLIEGQDEIALTLARGAAITAFEADRPLPAPCIPVGAAW